MATHRTTVNISITPELDAFLQAKVESGRYQTTSEVVREALRLLETSREGTRRSLQPVEGQAGPMRRPSQAGRIAGRRRSLRGTAPDDRRAPPSKGRGP